MDEGVTGNLSRKSAFCWRRTRRKERVCVSARAGSAAAPAAARPAAKLAPDRLLWGVVSALLDWR